VTFFFYYPATKIKSFVLFFFWNEKTFKSKVFAFSGGPKTKVLGGSEGSKSKHIFFSKMRQI